MSKYKTPHALEMAIKEAAKASPMDTNRAITGFYFHRLLCRIFSNPDSPYVLKGGQGMLARTIDARYTRDIDLVVCGIDIDKAKEELAFLASIDLGDFIQFSLEETSIIKAEDEYREGYTLTFAVTLGAKRMQSVSIDLVVDQVEIASIERISPVDRIEIAGLDTYDYPIYPIERVLADKFLGIVERHAGRPSSRVKDLVDIVICLTKNDIRLNPMCFALIREMKIRKVESLFTLNIPKEWGVREANQYAKLATQANSPSGFLDMESAVQLAQKFYEKALGKSSHEDLIWNHSKCSWEQELQ